MPRRESLPAPSRSIACSTMSLGKRSRSLPVIAHRVVRWISCRGSRRPVTPTSRALSEPFGDPRAARESAELLRRLLDAGLSRFEPDPLGAIEEAEGKRRAAK